MLFAVRVTHQGCGLAPLQASVKERCKAVSAAVAAIHESQSSWAVPDATLRTNLRAAVAEDFLPPYAAFVERGGGLPARNAEKYIKYSVSTLASLGCLMRVLEPRARAACVVKHSGMCSPISMEERCTGDHDVGHRCCFLVQTVPFTLT